MCGISVVSVLLLFLLVLLLLLLFCLARASRELTHLEIRFESRESPAIDLFLRSLVPWSV